MFNKINICKVIKGHYTTFYRTKKSIGKDPVPHTSWWDLTLFIGIPILVIIGIMTSFYWYPVRVSELILTIISASSAAFFALMLTVLFSIVDRSEKLDHLIKVCQQSNTCTKKLTNHKKIFRELYFNISYSMIAALFLIIFSIVTAIFIPEKTVSEKVTVINSYISFAYTFFSALVIAIGLNLVFTLLMIIKRVYSVFEPDL